MAEPLSNAHKRWILAATVLGSSLTFIDGSALGVALPYAVANALFGGTAEYVGLWFKQQGMESGSYIYVSAMMAVAFVVALRLRNTNRDSLITED